MLKSPMYVQPPCRVVHIFQTKSVLHLQNASRDSAALKKKGMQNASPIFHAAHAAEPEHSE